MHAPRPSNLPVCSLEKETPQTSNTACLARCHLGEDQQCNFPVPPLVSSRRATLLFGVPPRFLPQLRSLLTLSLLTPSPRPLPPFCLIASAPPYNHAGSRLSFGVVYIAVIVRAQCRDWAEHVYSFTGPRRHKSARGEEKVFRSRRGGVVGAHQPSRAHAATFTGAQQR